MKICVVLVVFALVGALSIRTVAQVSGDGTTIGNAGLSAVPKIMIESGTKTPTGAIESEDQATSGTVDGTLVVENLTVQGPLVVDGQLLVGDHLWSPRGPFVLTSAGNRNAAPPGKPALVWKNVNVNGTLTVHGSLIVHHSLNSAGNVSIGGVMGALCSPRRVFYPAGEYPIASTIEFGCSRS